MINTTKVLFRVKKDIYWDNGGQATLVATKGSIIKGELFEKTPTLRSWEYGSIESMFHKGITDIVSSEEVEVVK